MRWAFWRRPRRDQELEEELRFHLEMQTRQNLAAGMDREEARYAAQRSFGGVAQVTEDCRDQWRRRWLADLRQDLRYGVRTLGRTPGFTTVAVLSLALGIGATAAIFSVVHAVLLRSLPYREPDRLVMVYDRPPNRLRFSVSPANFLDWRAQNQVFSGMAAFARQGLTLTGWEDARRVWALSVSADFFSILGVPAAQGRTFRPEEDSPAGHQVVVLSHSLRTRLFAPGDNPIGRTLELDGESHTVIGVLPPSFRFQSQFYPVEIELWRPNPFRQDPPTQRAIHRLSAIARLKPGVTTQQAQAEMDRIAGGLQQAYPDTNKNWGVTVWPLADDLVLEVRPALLILVGAVVFVLLIACANVAGLLLARAAARQREVAVRSALGAGRMRLVRQLLTEAVLVSLVGAALGVLLARWAVPSLVALSPASLPRADTIAVDERVLGFTLLVAVLTGLLFGLAPAVLGSRPNLNESLKEARRVAAPVFPRWRLDSVFVVVQVALCLVLLTGAGLLLNSFLRYRAVALGFDPVNVMTIRVSLPRTKYAQRAGIATQAPAKGIQIWAVRSEHTAFVEQVLGRVRRLPGVVSAAATNYLPMEGERSWSLGFTIEGRPKAPNQSPAWALIRPVTPDFFRAAGLPLLKGRSFTAQDRDGSLDVVIVSEVLARKHWPDADPLGKRLLLHDGRLDRERPFEIVGVAGNTRQGLLLAEQGEEDGVLYLPYRQQAPAYLDSQIGFRMSVAFLVRTSANPRPLAKALREAIRDVDRDQPITSITTLEEFVASGETQRRFYLLLLGVFAGVALTLAAVGVFGVVHYSVAQRTHEIGVRIALGAGQGDVLRLVLKRGVALTLAGVVLGLGGALGLGRYLANQLYRVTPQDPSTLAAVSLLLVAVAVAASWLPAHRATRVDPIEALRHE